VPLDVVVPDLLLPPQAAETLRELRLPHLERWIARGRNESMPMQGSAPWIAQRFGIQAPFPVAAVTLAADAEPRDGAWLRADPVHLQISSESVALHDASLLDIHRDEATALVAVLQDHFAGDGFDFLAPHPTRWYVRVPDGEVPRTTPLETVLGRNVFGLLPRGDGKINWSSAITETQMLFATHDVNAEREANGRPAINSVWFWGEGAAPAQIVQAYALVYAHDAFARGLGRISETRLAEPPAAPEGVDMVDENRSALVVLDALTAPLHRGDAEAWLEAARHLDETWFANMPRMLERFDTVRIVLPGHHETRVATIDASARWRWFRGRAPLNAHA
jgi:hypothetical protein